MAMTVPGFAETWRQILAAEMREINNTAVRDYSYFYLNERKRGDMRAAIIWRRGEFDTVARKDAAEAEERRWWAHNKLETTHMPEANPKAARAVADGKIPLDYLEPVANEMIAMAIKSGADKYGRRNFADPDTEMRMSTYVGAFLRHATALQRGEWYDPDSGLPHLAHIGANVHVVLAAREAGTLRYDTRDTKVTKRSDAVHGDGNMDARGYAWGDNMREAPHTAETNVKGAAWGVR